MWLVAKLKFSSSQFSSVAQSCPPLCDTMDCSMPGLPCPSPTPGAYSNSCPSSWWCHPTISSSVIPFSSCFQYFPASGSLPISQFFASDDQSIGASASASALAMNIQGWFRLGLTGFTLLSSSIYIYMTWHTMFFIIKVHEWHYNFTVWINIFVNFSYHKEHISEIEVLWILVFNACYFIIHNVCFIDLKKNFN